MNETSHFKIYFSSFSLIAITLTFNYFFSIKVWEVSTYFPYFKYFYVLLVPIYFALYFTLMVKSHKHLLFLALFRIVTFAFVLLTFFIGCGAVWYYIFEKYTAFFINITTAFAFFGIILFRVQGIKHYYREDFMEYISKISFVDFTVNRELLMINDFVNIITIEKYIQNKIFSKIFYSIGSFAPFLVMGIAFSLEKVGSKLHGLVFVNMVFYFCAIIFVFSNFVSKLFAYNLLLINYIKSNRLNISFK